MDDWDSVSSPTAPADSWDSVSSTQPEKKSFLGGVQQALKGARGAYTGAALTGLLAEPVRFGMEHLDYGGYNEKIRKAFPGQTDEWYKNKVHDLYNQALIGARESAAKDVKDNPYPGQTVGNFTAGVLGSADPTWFINPAGGIEKGVAATGLKGASRVAANIGAHAAVNAGLGSASDLAAQGMDIAEGVQKDFDVQRNLESAAAAGAFGAGFAGVHEVSPFVKDLFKQRGRDTTPGATPMGDTAPLTTESVNFSPEQRAQFKELLRTGSVDDIKGFLADKQGPKPTWQDVNRLVEVRDSLPEQYVGQQNFESAIQDQKRQVIQQHVADQTKGWKNAPDIEFVSSPDDIADPTIREKYVKDDPNGDALGFYGADGKVRLFQDRIDTPDMLNSVLYHESLGHHGLQQKFGASLESKLNTLLDRNVGSLKKETADWIKRNGGKYRDRKALAAEEVLAEASEKGPLKKSWGDAIAHTVREYGRRMGMKLSYSDAEIAHILSMAHDAVINGHGRNAAANGFRGRPLAWNDQNKFMFTGPKALGFDPEHPMAFTPSDGVRRNEISDKTARLNMKNVPVGSEVKKLGDVLDHPDLFENYPQLADTPVTAKKIKGVSGSYDPQTGHINLSPYGWNGEEALRSTLLHEVQHRIQHEEGLLKPGESTMGSSYEEYMADPREKEAYLTEDRKNMSFLDRYRDKPNMYKRRDQKSQEKFDRWFDGSYVVNKDGEPLTVYHGSNKSFDEFDIEKAQAEPGLFFTEDPDAAASYTNGGYSNAGRDQLAELADQQQALDNMISDRKAAGTYDERVQRWAAIKTEEIIKQREALSKYGANIIPVNLAIKNPYVVDGEGRLYNGALYRSLIAHAEQFDKDGVIIHNIIDRGDANRKSHSVYIAFDPKQIKSVFNDDIDPFSNKFMRKSDYLEKENAVHSIEQAYKAMDEYEPTVRPIAQTKQAAIDAGINPSDVNKLGKTPELSKRIARLAGAASVLDQRISGLLERLDTPEWSVGDEYKLQQAIVEHSYVINKLLNDQAEAGRALRIIQEFNYTKKSFESMGQVLKESGTTLAGLGDRDMLLKFARSLKTLNGKSNPNGLNTAVRQLSRHNWEDYVTTLHNNMMLSGLSTHIKAPQDMLIGIGRELLESSAASVVGSARIALRAMGVPIKEGVHPAEAVGRLYGIMKAVLEADTYRNTLATLKTGVNPSKYATSQHINFARIPGVSKIGDLIAAQDAFFRAVMTNMHLYGLGARDATQRGVKGWDNIMSHMSNIAHFPDSHLLNEAKALADKGLLLNENTFTKQLNKIKYAPKGSGFGPRLAAFMINYTAPFLRVASNSIMERTIRRSPLALIDKETRQALAKGGPEGDLAAMRIIFGTATVFSALAAAKQGMISGDGPDNPAKRAELMASGWRPNAVKNADGSWSTGNTLGMSVNPFDLHNATASIVANAYEAGVSEENKLNAIKLAMYSTFKSLAKEGYVGDISETMEALFGRGYGSDSDRIDKFLGAQASTMVVPNALGQLSRVTQQDQPDTTDYPVTGQIRANLPWERPKLPVKHDVYGQPVKSGATWEGVHGLGRGNHQEAPTDPAIIEMVRIGKLAKSAIVSPVPRTLTIGGERTKLDAHQYQQYQETVGKELVAQVNAEMQSGQWDQMSDEQKAQELKDIQKDVRKSVKEYLYGE